MATVQRLATILTQIKGLNQVARVRDSEWF
ncbi:hypothetical protein SPHINGO8AM_90133 [Sphingomonas sp. 8AM]|nr:hypothetical protein SPHINGO8AM_90133 [Sphingomonas sp. 8AM]